MPLSARIIKLPTLIARYWFLVNSNSARFRATIALQKKGGKRQISLPEKRIVNLPAIYNNGAKRSERANRVRKKTGPQCQMKI